MPTPIIIIALVVAAIIIIMILRSRRSSESSSEQISGERSDRSSSATRSNASATTGGSAAASIPAQSGSASDGDWRSEIEDPNLTSHRFTMLYMQAVREMAPEAQVTIIEPLRVKVRGSDGRELVCNLENLLKECADAPGGKRAEVLTRGLGAIKVALFEREEMDGDDISERIVPVVRDREWIDAMESQARERGLAESGLVYEPLNEALSVIYAIDFPEAMRYLQSAELPEGIDRGELRKIALMNLMRICEPIGIAFTEIGGYVQAGGTYESSLLLLDSLWDEQQKELGGEIVATVPARHILAFSSSSSEEGLAALRELAAQSDQHGGRAVSRDLFVWRNGAWMPFSTTAA